MAVYISEQACVSSLDHLRRQAGVDLRLTDERHGKGDIFIEKHRARVTDHWTDWISLGRVLRRDFVAVLGAPIALWRLVRGRDPSLSPAERLETNWLVT